MGNGTQIDMDLFILRQEYQPHWHEKDRAFLMAIMDLRKEGQKKWWVRWSRRLRIGAYCIRDRYVLEFAKLGSLEGVLKCCGVLGIDKNEVRAIHALIYT